MDRKHKPDHSWIKQHHNSESSNAEGEGWQCDQCNTPNEADAWHCKNCRKPRRKGGDTSYEISKQSDFSYREKDGKRQSFEHVSEHQGDIDYKGGDTSYEISKQSDFSYREKDGKRQSFEHVSEHQGDIDYKDDIFDGISHNERRIILIGKTGSGKSATGNTILGKSDDGFVSKTSVESITKYCQRREVERFGKKLMVVDTPGVFDTNTSNEYTKKEIGKCIGITSPGPHAIVLVVQINRFTEEEQKTVDLFVERFGEGMYRHLIVLFTRKDDLERTKTSLSTYVKGTKILDSLLQKCQNRYIAFDNFSQDKDKDVQSLLDMIEDIVQKNGGKSYANDMLNEAENAMKRRMAAIREEESKKKAKELKEIKKSHKAEINKQKQEKEQKQREIEMLESKRQKELQRQEEENRRLKKDKENIEKERQKEASDFKATKRQLEEHCQMEKERAEKIKREKEEEEQEKQIRDREEFEKQLQEHKRSLQEAVVKEMQLQIRIKEEQNKNIAALEEKYEQKTKEEELRKKARDEVEERGFFQKVFDIITFKWLRE